jgi:hypothetical protein
MWVRILRTLPLLSIALTALVLGVANAQTNERADTQSPQSANTTTLTLPPATVGQILREMTAQAGVVFIGRVRAIRFDAAPLASHQAGTVTITLDVLLPISVTQGTLAASYVLREWSGLWTMGRQRYVVGQQALFFLRPPNTVGLSTPVGGQTGIVPLVPLTAGQAPLLDARLLAANVLRREGDLLPYAGTSGLSLTDAIRIVQHPTQALEPSMLPLPGSLEPSSDPAADSHQPPAPSLPIGSKGIHPIQTDATPVTPR